MFTVAFCTKIAPMITSLSTFLLLSLCAQTTTVAEDSKGNLSGSTNLGLTLISGNSQSSNSVANIDLSYLIDVHKFDFGIHYQAVRDTNQLSDISTTSSRLYRSDFQYNHYLSTDQKTYIWTNLATRQDEPTGLNSRNNLGAGMGYHLMFANDLDIFIEAGASYVNEQKSTSSSEATVSRLAFDFKWPVSDDLSLISSSEFLSGDNIETYVQDFSLRYNLKNNWFLQLANNTAYDAFPADGSETTDSRWNISLGTSF